MTKIAASYAIETMEIPFFMGQIQRSSKWTGPLCGKPFLKAMAEVHHLMKIGFQDPK